MKRLVVASLLVVAAGRLDAQLAASSNAEPLPRSFFGGGALYYGSPQGEFANNVAGVFGGGGFMGWQVGSSPFALRADLGFSIYGSERRRMPLGSGALGLIMVDVNTTNNIAHGGIGLQMGLPGAGLRPYVGGSVGFAEFFTSSSVSGTHTSTGNEPFASSTNLSDGTFAKTLFGGVYIPVGSRGGALDLGLRYHLNGEARYLTERDITFDGGNNPVLHPRFSRADLLTFQVGFAFKRR